jgi:hypothetical protein
VDVQPFKKIVDLALVAFGSDFGYAEQMLMSAQGISRKREVWSYRTEARQAEAKAKAQCRERGGPCNSISPCGFGDCAFATPENAKLVIVSTTGGECRESPGALYPQYTRETVVASVLARVSRTVA